MMPRRRSGQSNSCATCYRSLEVAITSGPHVVAAVGVFVGTRNSTAAYTRPLPHTSTVMARLGLPPSSTRRATRAVRTVLPDACVRWDRKRFRQRSSKSRRTRITQNRSHLTSSNRIFVPRPLIRNGPPTSAMSRPTRGGCIWPL